jgi:serine protease Do
MTAIDELQSTIASVAARLAPSVVGIGSRIRGAGVVIDDGRVLTNAHNLRGDEVTVTFHDGRRVRGTVSGVDRDGDLAVIAVDSSGATPLKWGDPDPLTIGTVVFGAAMTASRTARVTVGTVSSLEQAFRGPGGRRIAGSIEHTAPLAPGSSGGPLVDADGRLVGLNTNRIGEGFYLALPTGAALRERIEALGRGESVERRRLGVAVAPSHVARRLRRSVGLPERDGLLVRGVEDDSPAAAAGIAAGDLIVEAAGRPITDADDLADALAAAGPTFDVRIVRGADELQLSVGAA